MKKIDKGYMNNNYLDEKIFIKKLKPIADDYLDKKNIKKSLDALMNSDLSLKNIVVPTKTSYEGEILVSEFPYFSNAKNVTQDQLHLYFDEIIKMLQEFHQVSIDDAQSFNPRTKIAYFLKRIDDQLFPYDEYLAEVNDVFANLETKHHFAFCHNDLNVNNFIVVDNKIKLIDFDTASTNTPLFDYISFVTESLTLYGNFADAKIFIQKLKDKNLLTDNDNKDINQMFKAQNFLWTLWANYFYCLEKQPIYKEIAETMFFNFIEKSLIY